MSCERGPLCANPTQTGLPISGGLNQSKAVLSTRVNIGSNRDWSRWVQFGSNLGVSRKRVYRDNWRWRDGCLDRWRDFQAHWFVERRWDSGAAGRFYKERAYLRQVGCCLNKGKLLKKNWRTAIVQVWNCVRITRKSKTTMAWQEGDEIAGKLWCFKWDSRNRPATRPPVVIDTTENPDGEEETAVSTDVIIVLSHRWSKIRLDASHCAKWTFT